MVTRVFSLLLLFVGVPVVSARFSSKKATLVGVVISEVFRGFVPFAYNVHLGNPLSTFSLCLLRPSLSARLERTTLHRPSFRASRSDPSST